MTKSTIEMNRNPSGRINRRQILCGAGAGAAAVLAGSLPARGQCCQEQRVLNRGDRIEIDGKGEEIVQRAYDLGCQYEKEHGGCARCIVAALQDAIPFVAVDVGLFRGSTCLDGGATPVNIQNCGAFTGAGMVVGHLCGSTRAETFQGDATLAHELLHKVYERFKEHYETVLCRDVREGAKGDCVEVVGRAAKWTAEVLLAEFTDYTPPEPQQEDDTQDAASDLQ